MPNRMYLIESDRERNLLNTKKWLVKDRLSRLLTQERDRPLLKFVLEGEPPAEERVSQLF